MSGIETPTGTAILHVQGALTGADVKSYIRHEADLPTGQAALAVRFAFSPAVVSGQKNMLTLSIFDPTGFRGAGHRHGNLHEVVIGPESATPGYLPGELPAGRWTIEIDTHMVMPGEECRYTLDVEARPAASEARAGGGDPSDTNGTGGASRGTSARRGQSASAGARLSSGAVDPAPARGAAASYGEGWFRGDLHSHTFHSDASWGVADLVARARGLGLDFLALTDHNTTSGLEDAHAAASDGLLIIDGLELTTYWGHALCLGTNRWVDWRTGPGALEMPAIARERIAAGETFIIAHPSSIGDPYCTGCRWVYDDMRPGPARLFEVWNGPWSGDSNNEEALAFWYDLLTQGVRIYATAGSDTHNSAGYAGNVGFNVVRAGRCDQASILSAIRSGAEFLSNGPALFLEGVAANGARVLAAAELPGKDARIEVRFDNATAGSRLRLVGDGRIVHEAPVSRAGTQSIRPDDYRARWYVAELRGPDGEMSAVTNPIFVA